MSFQRRLHVRSRRCWGATRPVRSGVGAGAGCDETNASSAISLLFLSLSLFYFPGVEII